MEGPSRKWGGKLGLGELVFMASTASALSLANFEVITSSSVSLACMVVYDTPIPGCTPTDFSPNEACSPVCQDGLNGIQATLQTICGNPRISSQSVLGEALSGNLVQYLCGAESTTTTTVVSSSTRAPSTTSTTTTSTTELATTSQTTTSATPETSSSTSQVPSTTTSSVSTIPTSTAVSSSAVVDTSTTEQTTAVQPAQTSSQQTSSTQSTSSAADTAISGSRGGGDPFDPAIIGGSVPLIPSSWLLRGLSLVAALMLLQ